MQSITPEVRSSFQQISDLVGQLLRLLSQKERYVIERRFNLDHTRMHTLEEIGQHFQVTRERVRQIEKSALQKLRRNAFTTLLPTVFSFSKEFLQERGGVLRQDFFFSALLQEVLDTTSVHLESLRLALELDPSFSLTGNTIQFHPFIRLQEIPENVVEDVCENAFRILDEHGEVMKKDDFFARLQKVYSNFTFAIPAFFASVLPLDKRIKILNSMYGLFEWRHIHPRTLRDKIFFTLRENKKPIHFVEISNRILNSNFDKKRVNVQAVHNELIRCDEFILIGRGIYALREWGYDKGTVTEVVEEILKEKGEMDQEDIVSEVLKRRQVKRITILLALKNEKKYERVGRKRYKLISRSPLKTPPKA